MRPGPALPLRRRRLGSGQAFSPEFCPPKTSLPPAPWLPGQPRPEVPAAQRRLQQAEIAHSPVLPTTRTAAGPRPSRRHSPCYGKEGHTPSPTLLQECGDVSWSPGHAKPCPGPCTQISHLTPRTVHANVLDGKTEGQRRVKPPTARWPRRSGRTTKGGACPPGTAEQPALLQGSQGSRGR